MKLFATLLGALALLAGFAAGMRAYTASATTPPQPPLAAAPHHPPAQVVRPGVVVRWAPCQPPAVRHGRVCVTHVTRTVTLPSPPVAAPASTTVHAPQTAPTRPSHSVATRSHNGGEHEDGGGHDD